MAWREVLSLMRHLINQKMGSQTSYESICTSASLKFLQVPSKSMPCIESQEDIVLTKICTASKSSAPIPGKEVHVSDPRYCPQPSYIKFYLQKGKEINVFDTEESRVQPTLHIISFTPKNSINISLSLNNCYIFSKLRLSVNTVNVVTTFYFRFSFQ